MLVAEMFVKLVEIAQVVQQPQRLGKLVHGLTGLPHAAVRGLIDHGCVLLDGEAAASAGLEVPAGARLEIRYDPQRGYPAKPRPRVEHAYRLVFEDPHLLVVDKSAGVLTVPTERREQSALVYALASYLSRGRRVRRRVAIVHRLDRDTSGLLVFAKRQQVADALKNQFRARKPEREYMALVAGELREPRGTFRGYLATDAALNQYSTPHPERGKLAVTHYEAVRTLPGATLVRVRLETGRRNQIRVHFAEIGHPILGDVRYRPELARHPRWTYRRLALHATVLGFTHPETEHALRFESPLPEEFTDFLQAAGGSRTGATGQQASAPRRRRGKRD